MAISIETKAIDNIVNYCPPKVTDQRGKGQAQRDLGEVDGARVEYGPQTYPARLIDVPGEPYLDGKLIRQPVLSLVEDGARITLAYRTDVAQLGADRITRLAEHLAAQSARQN